MEGSWKDAVRKFVPRMTPARAFLLGTAVMLILPDWLYYKMSIGYHSMMQDNTYIMEESIQSAESLSQEQSRKGS